MKPAQGQAKKELSGRTLRTSTHTVPLPTGEGERCLCAGSTDHRRLFQLSKCMCIRAQSSVRQT